MLDALRRLICRRRGHNWSAWQKFTRVPNVTPFVHATHFEVRWCRRCGKDEIR